jgi:autotransporter-associated beta strand protein
MVLGAIIITGDLDLDADITSATSLSVSADTNLAADVTTTGTQTYGDDAASDTVTLEAAINFTTTDSNITFNSIIDSNNATPKAITIDMDNSGVGADGTVTFAGVVGTNEDVAAIGITGNLDLNAAIGNGATAGATSINVSGTTNLGASITTTGTQQYDGVTTLSTNVTLTTTSNGTVSFGNTTDSDATDRTLAITTNGTGDVSFTGAVGGTGGLNGLTIDTNQFNAAALTVGGTISITNTDTASSEITGVIADDGDAAVFTKAGTGTLTLSGTNTYTGATTVNNGTLTVSGSGKLGNGNYSGTLTVASGKIFNYSSSSAQTFSDWGAGTGTINLNGSGEVTLSGNQDFTGTLNVSQMLIMVGVNANTEIAGLGNATTIDIQNGGTIKIQHVNHNAFLGYQSTGAPDIYIRTGGELTTDDDNGAYGIHIGGSLTLDGGTLSWEEASGDYSINTFAGTWTLDQDIVVTDDSTISAPGLVSLETDGNTTFTVSENKTLTVSGYFYDSSTHIEVAVEKAGAGTMILQAAGTHLAAFTVSAGTLKVTADDALGTTAAGTTVASGATLDFANVAYATAEAVTVNGGTISTSTGTSSFAGAITLGAHSTFDIDGTQLTVSGNVTDGDGIYNITKTGNGILVLSNTTNSYDGTTTISAGTLTVTGRLDSGSYSADIINNSALIYNSASAQTFAGEISGNGTLEKANASSTLTLSGTNTYSGLTTISGGIIAISDAAALGTTAGATTVDSGAALYISNDITVAEPITISGTGVSSSGAIRFTANDNTYSGAITLGATATIVSNSGQQIISGTINGSNDNTEALTITANDDLTISGAIGGIANKQLSTLDITTTGTGVLTLSNNITTDDDQTYTAAGGVLLGANISLTATSSDILFSETSASFVDTFSVASKETGPTGLTFNNDGTKMYVVGYTGDAVHEYSLSTGFDISSASFTRSFDISSQENFARSIVFNNDGSKMFVTGIEGDDVNEYTLSTPFNVATASFVDSFSVFSVFNNPEGLTFNDDGTKMYVARSFTVAEFSLSSAFDVSTASHAQTDTLSGMTGGITDIEFNNDGSKLFISVNGDDAIGEYSLSTNYDISTASFIDSYSTADTGDDQPTPADFSFNSDGTKMFVLDNRMKRVGEYTLTVAFDLNQKSTIDSTGGTRTLTVSASEIEFDGIVGGSSALGAIGITGALDLDADITSATSLSVSADTNLAADVTTSGTQTYTGAVTTDGSRTLQGSTIQFVSTVTGTTAASDDLTITGILNLDGAITDINDLYVSGTSDLGANVTTTGTQEYNNNVTLSGAARTLTTSGETVTFTGTVNGARDLTVDTTNSGGSSACNSSI